MSGIIKLYGLFYIYFKKMNKKNRFFEEIKAIFNLPAQLFVAIIEISLYLCSFDCSEQKRKSWSKKLQLN